MSDYTTADSTYKDNLYAIAYRSFEEEPELTLEPEDGE